MGRTSWAEGEVLLASSTERIRDRLVARGEQPKFFDPISQEVEAELLARRERLLDLTLAEFCLYPKTAQTLFFREPADETLRLLVLSNAAMAKAGFFAASPIACSAVKSRPLRSYPTCRGVNERPFFPIRHSTIAFSNRSYP